MSVENVLMSGFRPLVAEGLSWPAIIVLVVAGVFFLLFLWIFMVFFKPWIQSKLTHAGISLWDLVAMKIRKVDPRVIVRARIMAVQTGLGDSDGIYTRSLEAHYLAGGNVPQVIRAIVAAHKAQLGLTFKEAAAIDLAGRNVLEAVQTSINPRVIDCPPTGTLSAVAQNGIELKVRARVTVRSNLRQIIGGATQETIIARVGEGIVSAIGSASTHWDVLEKPDLISKRVLSDSRRLDSQTAFEIVSIDIADIDVGSNIGARLQVAAANAELQVARANAEGRRAAAVATEQEYVALIEENRAKVVAAEAEVPQAIADGFASEKLGLLDYYRLKNVQADTEMRQTIAGTNPSQNGK